MEQGTDSSKEKVRKGRGWHGDPAGHARAGRKSSGKFQKGSQRAKEAGRKGGSQPQTR